MMLTEEEAKTKWCPQMAHHELACDETERRGQTNIGGVIAARCIASECMAWRFEGTRTETVWIDPKPTPQQEADAAERGESYCKPHYAETRVKTGYCGLASRPAAGE